MTTTKVRLAVTHSIVDEDGMCGIAMANAIENNERHLYDETYAMRHVRTKLASGPCFLAEENEALIGVVTSSYVDMAYRQADALEITHTYVLPHRRKYPVVAALFDAVEAYADEHRLAVCFHELNWLAAINGEPSAGDRVARLYEFRKYEGPIVSSYMRQAATSEGRPPYRHVGRGYLYRGARCPDCPIGYPPDVRRPKSNGC